MADVMIDIETMGTGKRAAIVQLGAVKFSALGAPLPEICIPDAPNVLYVNVSLESCVKMGMQMDASTLDFWLHKAPEEARRSLTEPQPITIQAALARLKKFVDWKQDFVWAKGPSFDHAILSEAFRLSGDTYGAWNFARERCVRTALDWGRVSKEFEAKGVEHNALADAWHQARCVQYAASNLGLSQIKGLKWEG